SYLQYAQVCARAVRNSLKEEARVVAIRRDEQGLKYAKWEAGKQGELKNTVGNRTVA
ncbi:mitochondrial ATP synthase epsilon chain-domain-containing protein, partial [Linnemannia elongata]